MRQKERNRTGKGENGLRFNFVNHSGQLWSRKVGGVPDEQNVQKAIRSEIKIFKTIL